MTDYIHMPTLVVLGAAALVALVSKAYKVYSSPISKLPGSEISKWTDLLWWWTLVRSTRVSTEHNTLAKYGPVARISPHDVVVSDPDAVRQIFSFSSGFVKDKWYTQFTGTVDGDNLFSTITPKLHQQRRRLLGQSMSESHLRTIEPTVRNLCQLLIQRIQDDVKRDGCVDVCKWFLCFSTDVIGELTFGDSFRMLETGGKEGGQNSQYIKDIRLAGKAGALYGAFPVLGKFFKLLPLKVVRDTARSQDNATLHAETSIRRYRAQLAADPDNTPDTLFSKIWKSHEAGLITDESLAKEARSYLIAGTDTTAYTMTFLVYELIRHPAWQDRIRAEVARLPAGFSSKDAAALPDLHLAIQETLRLHGPVQSSLPRVVPAAGLSVAGHFIPPGTTVHPQSYSTHRLPAVFPDGDAWRPDRWAEPTRDMNDMFLAFGGGSRACIGRNLALMEIALGMADLFTAFPGGLRVADERTSPADMAHSETFLAGPVGGKCFVRPA